MVPSVYALATAGGQQFSVCIAVYVATSNISLYCSCIHIMHNYL